MIEFEISKTSKKSKARLGKLITEHGVVETPTFVPVATQATIKALESSQVVETGSQMLISNTFHLHLKPGEEIVKKAGGLHKFMNWQAPLMTDSGGYQVFSLGFGKDLQVGKIAKANDSGPKQNSKKITVTNKPRDIKIYDDGVEFRSPVNGDKLFIGPKESIKIQEQLGADIIFAFDECTAPQADHEYTRRSLKKTHDWAKKCIDAKKSDQAMYGVVQGGKFEDLRRLSAKVIADLPFAGFGIGGEFGDDKKGMTKMIDWVIDELPNEKPRHLLGIGHLEDIPEIIKAGVDTFDCVVPTQYARRGIAFTREGKLNLIKAIFRDDFQPLDPRCVCSVCQNYTRSYLHHLFKAKEISAMSLMTMHNLFYFNEYVVNVRAQISSGKI